jgi:alkaline phosphatase
MDRHVTEWIEEIRRNTDNDTTVVITSDHGHNLGTEADEFLFGHHTSLSEAVLHVPLLIINPPDGYPEQQDKLVSHLDLGALLVVLAHGDRYRFHTDHVLAEVIGHTGAFPVSSKVTSWDRLICCVYDETDKTTWDSLGTVDAYTVDRESPSQQTHVTSMDGSYPESDVRHFDVDIRTAKRTAVLDEIDSRDTDAGSKVEQRLSDLGYV